MAEQASYGEMISEVRKCAKANVYIHPERLRRQLEKRSVCVYTVQRNKQMDIMSFRRASIRIQCPLHEKANVRQESPRSNIRTPRKKKQDLVIIYHGKVKGSYHFDSV